MHPTFPAEWSPHEAVWLAWPYRRGEWGEVFDDARREVAGLIRGLLCGDGPSVLDGAERIELLVGSCEADTNARDTLAGLPVRFHRSRYADIWVRDTGPLFVYGSDGRLEARCFDFDGWGWKYCFPEDRGLARKIGDAAGARSVRVPFVLEGGSVEVDGEGTLLTTRDCLLGPVRNPGVSCPDVEVLLRRELGAERVIWLDGALRNDHTDGHIDTLARFVSPGRVVCMKPESELDPNFEVLTGFARCLRESSDARGRRLEVVTIPSPAAVEDSGGELLPASYVNFFVGNRVVVVPQYGVQADRGALTALTELFPDHEVIGRPASALLTGGGAFHCITQQQPAAKGVQQS